MNGLRRGRLRTFAAGLLLWGAVVTVRLVQLQIAQGSKYRARAERQQQKRVEVAPRRGSILDRDGRELAVSVEAATVYASPDEIEDRAAAARALARLTGAPEAAIAARLASSRSFVSVVPKIEVAQAAAVRAAKIPGVQIVPDTKRFYPRAELAAAVLGFVGMENHGLEGLEYFYDKVVGGKPGEYVLLTDARRSTYGEAENRNGRPPQEGASLVLSLDSGIQFAAEKELMAAVSEHHAHSGSIVVLDPNNGEILAMASAPGFDPNAFNKSPAESRRNRAVGDAYEPGSTFKIVTGGLALENRVITPDEVIETGDGTIHIGNVTISESDNHQYGAMKLAGVFEHSSNIGIIRVGLRLGPERLYAGASAFGIGRDTGVDLPGENTGIFRPLARWSSLSNAEISMGQEVAVTALQLARVVAVVANGGWLVRPHLVTRVVEPDGSSRPVATPQAVRVLSPSTARILSDILVGVVERGTGHAGGHPRLHRRRQDRHGPEGGRGRVPARPPRAQLRRVCPGGESPRRRRRGHRGAARSVLRGRGRRSRLREGRLAGARDPPGRAARADGPCHGRGGVRAAPAVRRRRRARGPAELRAAARSRSAGARPNARRDRPLGARSHRCLPQARRSHSPPGDRVRRLPEPTGGRTDCRPRVSCPDAFRQRPGGGSLRPRPRGDPLASGSVNLVDLLAAIPEAEVAGHHPSGEIRRVTGDSRLVGPGDVFVAIRGEKADGLAHAAEAAARGALAVVSDRPRPGKIDPSMPWVRVPAPRRALALLAARLAGSPAERLVLAGVTGTNGKTTTTTLLEAIFSRRYGRSGFLGTVGYRTGRREIPADRTTPDAAVVQGLLADMVAEGLPAAVVEVSSHGLALDRVDGCRFDVAVFTNLTRDHLDFHLDMESYFAAKKRLFSLRKPGAAAVVNTDDPFGRRLAAELAPPVVTYSPSGAAADVRSEAARCDLSGTSLDVVHKGGRFRVTSPLLGRFNVANLLAASAAGLSLGIRPEDIAGACAAVSNVPGRLERVEAGQPYAVVVDYAHTEDALQRLLSAVRELSDKKIILVFGCGGDRDRGKRAPMGRIAGEMADIAIATSDNPRSENPDAILAEVESGLVTSGATKYLKIADRREAIRRSIELANPGTVVVIAGKGHETTQVIGTLELPFDDRKVAAEMIGRGRDA